MRPGLDPWLMAGIHHINTRTPAHYSNMTNQDVQQECLMTCEFCKDEIISIDDYSNHLILVHDVRQKNISDFLTRAAKQVQVDESRSLNIEEIVLGDDDGAEESEYTTNRNPGQAGKHRNIVGGKINEYVNDLFHNLSIIVDGILPEGFDNNCNGLEEEEEIVIPENLSNCFQELREYVDSLEVPPILNLISTSLKEDVGGKVDDADGSIVSKLSAQVQPDKTPQSTDIGPSIDFEVEEDIDMLTKHASLKSPGNIPTDEILANSRSISLDVNVLKNPASDLPSDHSKFRTAKSILPEDPQNYKKNVIFKESMISKNKENVSVKYSPNLKEKVLPKPKPGQTLFLCPLDKCDFFTTKEGFKNGLAAKHLREIHKLTAADMTVPGKFKFQKLKGEKVRNC